MIADNQTNFLYLADTLPIKYPAFYARFESLLKEKAVDFALLPSTKDIWAVDFMPIQISENNFVRFTYDPLYLKSKKYKNTISDVDAICKNIGIATAKTDIVIDGGNITHWKNKVILTDRIFKDNPQHERKALLKKLYELLQVDHLYLLPEQPGDFTGHADGMARFVDEHTVIINDYDYNQEKNKWFLRAFEIALHNAGLECIKIPYGVYDNLKVSHANGVYLNYLQMENKIFVPTFGKPEDDKAVKQLESIFIGQKVSTIECNDIAYNGGVLNCITWNILK